MSGSNRTSDGIGDNGTAERGVCTLQPDPVLSPSFLLWKMTRLVAAHLAFEGFPQHRAAKFSVIGVAMPLGPRADMEGCRFCLPMAFVRAIPPVTTDQITSFG